MSARLRVVRPSSHGVTVRPRFLETPQRCRRMHVFAQERWRAGGCHTMPTDILGSTHARIREPHWFCHAMPRSPTRLPASALFRAAAAAGRAAPGQLVPQPRLHRLGPAT